MMCSSAVLHDHNVVRASWSRGAVMGLGTNVGEDRSVTVWPAALSMTLGEDASKMLIWSVYWIRDI